VGYRESAGPRRSRYRRGSKHPRCLSSPSPPAMSRIARNPARLGKRAEHMIELVSSARRLGREIAPVVGVDRANAGAPARRHRCRRERVRQACSGCWSSGEPGRYIIRDRDCVYGRVFLRRLRAMGIRDRPIAPRSPWQNGCAERLIGSIRRDCLDHVIVFGERHLRHLLKSYQKYYNEARTHLSLQKDAPIPRAVQTVGQTLAVPILGGLHHQYIRA
jgi:hypothetical protein